MDAVDNLFSLPSDDAPRRPDPGADLRGRDGASVHTPDTDRDAVRLPAARLGPRRGTRRAEPATEGETAGPVESDSTGAAPRGSDIARAALEAARAQQAERGRTGPRRAARRGTGADPARRRRRGWSGPGADDRDPQPLGRVASRLSAQRGWVPNLANGSVFGRWAELVGAEVAEHATPTALRDGELTVQADSTAWATQLRLLQRQLLGRIAAGLGDGVVKGMRIHGPSAPSWRRGPRHVSGRGPRDTYG